jgi:glycosyltransferase 2 family protein
MRKALTLSIKVAVSGLLLYFTLSAVNIGAVTSRLSHIDAQWALLGLFFLVVQLASLTWRWQLLVARCGADLPFARLFRLSMIGVFFNQTLPSSAGGDAVRIWLLGKQSTWRIAAYSVLLDRVIGVVALAILVVLCLPWTLGLVRSPVGRAALLLIGCGCIAAGIVFVALSWRRRQFLQRWSPTRHLAAAAGIASSIFRSPSSLIAIFGSSIIVHLLTALAAWCAARAVGADLPLLYSLYLVSPVVLLTVIPISIAGWGVREGAMVVAFGYAGLAQSDGLIVSLLFGFGYLVLGIAGGLVWVLTNSSHDGVSPARVVD